MHKGNNLDNILLRMLLGYVILRYITLRYVNLLASIGALKNQEFMGISNAQLNKSRNRHVYLLRKMYINSYLNCKLKCYTNLSLIIEFYRFQCNTRSKGEVSSLSPERAV